MTLSHLGKVAAREVYQRRYARALETLGPDHVQTRALLGRLRVYLGRVPQYDSLDIEAITWRREARDVTRGSNWNRSARRAFDRRMRELIAQGVAA